MSKLKSVLQFVSISSLLFLSTLLPAQGVTGIWKTIDDTDGKEKSHVEIYKQDNIVFAKIIKLLPAAEDTHCHKCKGALKGTALVGLEIIRDLTQDGNEWKGGYIFDPAEGKEYRCKISLKDENTLKLRGYIGTPILGRTQEWYRVVE